MKNEKFNGATLYPLGKIAKTHGYDGTVVLVSDKPLDEELESSLKELFVMIDGLQVPFHVEKFSLVTDTSAFVQLEFVSSQNEALKIIGCETYCNVPQREQETDAEMAYLIGFNVCDAKYGDVGVIQEIKDYKGNIVLQIFDGKKEILVSYYPELVSYVDNDAKILHITAPDGFMSV